MGEKPLGLDEAPAQLGTMTGVVPPAGVDVPPPGMATGSISTTTSNIKNSGSATATRPPKGFEPTPTRPGDPFPDKPGPAGMAVKEQGLKVDGGPPGAERFGQTVEPVAMEGEPVPGLDGKLGKNPGGEASAASPVAGDDETPDGGDELDPMAGAGIVVTTRSNIKSSGS